MEQICVVKGNTFSEDINKTETFRRGSCSNNELSSIVVGMPHVLKRRVDSVLAYRFTYGDEHTIYKDGRFNDK